MISAAILMFVVTADANAAMTKMLTSVLTEVRELLGPRRHSTVVLDRNGWSPKLFRSLLAMGFDILTYRKGRTRRIAETRFSLHQAKLDGRAVKYLLHDQPVRFLKGKLRLRQVTRLTESGHQTPIVTSRWDLRAIVIADRMFERWRQENFFQYLREEYLIDALVDYEVEPDDPTRLVPNPARKALDQERRMACASLPKLQERFGAMAIDYVDGGTPQADFQKTGKKLRSDMEKATARIQKREARRDSLPTHLPLAEAQKGQEVVKLSTERKHLTNILKMVAFQIESDLVEMIRPHYKRAEDEGHTLVQTILQNAADTEPVEGQLRITLAPLSSPHRSRVVESLLRGAEQKQHDVSRHSASNALCGCAPCDPEAKKRTGFGYTMSGVLKARRTICGTFWLGHRFMHLSCHELCGLDGRAGLQSLAVTRGRSAVVGFLYMDGVLIQIAARGTKPEGRYGRAAPWAAGISGFVTTDSGMGVAFLPPSGAKPWLFKLNIAAGCLFFPGLSGFFIFIYSHRASAHVPALRLVN
jgi:hypothetical protein